MSLKLTTTNKTEIEVGVGPLHQSYTYKVLKITEDGKETIEVALSITDVQDLIHMLK